jgi:hypothetical protein
MYQKLTSDECVKRLPRPRSKAASECQRRGRRRGVWRQARARFGQKGNPRQGVRRLRAQVGHWATRVVEGELKRKSRDEIESRDEIVRRGKAGVPLSI